MIEENGANLSGGEKQKIALSRVIFSDADVFVLDEITSNIDKETAKEIHDTITSINKDRITFIISHDKTNVPYCNKIEDEDILSFAKQIELYYSQGKGYDEIALLTKASPAYIYKVICNYRNKNVAIDEKPSFKIHRSSSFSRYKLRK